MSSLSRPIDIEEFKLAIRDLSDTELSNIKKQITNSVQKLHTSNDLMSELLQEISLKLARARDEDVYQESDTIADLEKDSNLYIESINENEIVLQNQQERLDLLEVELGYRGVTTNDTIKTENNELKDSTKSISISQDNDINKNGIYL